MDTAVKIAPVYDFIIRQLLNFIKNTGNTGTHFSISPNLLLLCFEESIEAQQEATKSLVHLMELIPT